MNSSVSINLFHAVEVGCKIWKTQCTIMFLIFTACEWQDNSIIWGFAFELETTVWISDGLIRSLEFQWLDSCYLKLVKYVFQCFDLRSFNLSFNVRCLTITVEDMDMLTGYHVSGGKMGTSLHCWMTRNLNYRRWDLLCSKC